MQIQEPDAEQLIEQAIFLLNDHLRCLPRTGTNELTPTLAVKPTLDAREAEYFLLGIEHGVFSIDGDGYVKSEVLPSPFVLQLFWHRQERRILFREGVCQLATLSELLLKYHWPLKQIEMEPSFDSHPHLRYSVDILLRDAGGSLLAGCEVKSSDRELKLLLNGFQNCCERGQHNKNNCGFKKNHPKFEFCRKLTPGWFMAVSPGQKVSFRLSYTDDRVVIEEQTSVPTFLTSG